MPDYPTKDILTIEDAMRILDALVPMKTHWESFYAEGRFQPPFLQNLPDENLAACFDAGVMTAGRAIDLGCGPGRNAIYLARQSCDVRAIDLSKTAIEQALRRAEEARVSIDFIVGSVFDMQMEPDGYDIVYDSGLLHHLQPHRRPFYLNLVRQILKPDGLFGLVCFDDQMTPAVEDWIIYRNGAMPPGLGYPEDRLKSILRNGD